MKSEYIFLAVVIAFYGLLWYLTGNVLVVITVWLGILIIDKIMHRKI